MQASHKQKKIAIERKSVLHVLLVWPQWWSWADVSQKGVDFNKKFSKIKVIFWFDFHRCSHGPSKFRRHFRNKSCSILKLSKMQITKNVLLNWYSSMKEKLRKTWIIFDIEKWLWKSRGWVILHFLTPPH